MSNPSPIGPLVLVVFGAITEVFLLAAVGYVLARKGIVDKKTQKQVSSSYSPTVFD